MRVFVITLLSILTGNIYSHMRKHTGQMYCCRTCDFKSVNKTHLLEHEATHSGVVHKCALCKRHYSTIKSLINHVRKYHADTDSGKEYLSQFISTKEGNTVSNHMIWDTSVSPLTYI